MEKEKFKNVKILADIDGNEVFTDKTIVSFEILYNNGRVGKDIGIIRFDTDYMMFLVFSENDESVYKFEEICNIKKIN